MERVFVKEHRIWKFLRRKGVWGSKEMVKNLIWLLMNPQRKNYWKRLIWFKIQFCSFLQENQISLSLYSFFPNHAMKIFKALKKSPDPLYCYPVVIIIPGALKITFLCILSNLHPRLSLKQEETHCLGQSFSVIASCVVCEKNQGSLLEQWKGANLIKKPWQRRKP